MSDPILINMLIQAEGLSGKNADKRRAELEKKSQTELQALLSKNSEKPAYESGFYQSVGWTPKAKAQPKYTPSQQEAMQFMQEMLSDSAKTMDEQSKKENWISSGVNFVKETFNTEYAKSNVESAIQSTKEDFSALEESARKIPSEFETEFQKRRGVKFDEKKIEDCSQKAKDMAEFQAATDMVDALKAKLKNALVNDTGNNIERSGEKAILETLSAMGYTKIGDVIKAAMKGHENDPAVKNYLKEGGSFAVRKGEDGKIGIYRETEKGGWQPITQEQAQIIGKEIELRLNTLHSEILGVEIPENATSEDIAKLNEQKMAQYKEDYEKSFAQAYGKKDLKQLSQNYMLSQEQGQAYVQMGVNILAMAGAMFSGGGTLALASTGVMLTNPVGFIQKATDADGMTAADWKNYGSEVAEQAGWMALGMGAGKVGDLTRSFVKVKGLSKLMKDSGKSLDDFVKIAAKSPDIPADMAKSLKTITKLADTAGITTEVAADMATTIALQKDGATGMDWVMSIGGSLVGTKMQKVLAPMSKDAKVSHLMEAFKDFKLSENEAQQILKAMDDAQNGLAPLNKGTNKPSFKDIKSDIFNLKEPLENILDDHDLYIINGSYNRSVSEFIKAFFEADNIESFKESTNYYLRANLIDSLPQSAKEKFKARGIDLDKMNAVIKEDLNYDYNRKLPSQESFDKLFNVLADNKTQHANPENEIKTFLTKINPDTDNAGVQKVIKDYDKLLNSSDFAKLSNADKTVAKTVLILNSVNSGNSIKDITTLVNNLSLPKDAKDRIINLVSNKNLISDLESSKVDLNYAAAVLRDKRDLNVAFMLAENNVSDKTALNSLYQKLTEKLDKHAAAQGSPVMQTFIAPDRFKTDETTGVKYARSNENDVFLAHSVYDSSDSPAEDNIGSLLQSLNNPSEKNYLSTSLITEKSEVFANDSAYGVILKNRGKNTINAGMGQFSGYYHTFEFFARELTSDFVDENATLVKQYFKDNLEQSGIKLSDSEYVKLIEKINNKQYFSQLTQDVNIDGKTIKAEVLRNAAENANKKLADSIPYGEGGNNEVTSIVDGIEAVYARVDDISDVKPEIMQLAKDNNLKVILLGKPSRQKKDISNDSNYQSELAVLTEKFKNKEISAPQFMSAKSALKTKYQNMANTSVYHSSAGISERGVAETFSITEPKRGPVLEGGILADELDEVAPFAQRLENPPQVGDYISVPETRFNIKEFKNKLASLMGKDNKPVFSDYTINKFVKVIGSENFSAFFDEVRVKYGDEFTADVIEALSGNSGLNIDEGISLIRRLTDEFENTPENSGVIGMEAWLLNSKNAKAAQILLDMPKRENSTDDEWTNAAGLLEKANLFDDKKSVAALERAVQIKTQSGANAYDVRDIETIAQQKDIIASNIFTDEELFKLKNTIRELCNKQEDLETVSKLISLPENKELQEQIKDILNNNGYFDIVNSMRTLKPQLTDKITYAKINDIQDKNLKSLVKRNINKINDPQKRRNYLESMSIYLNGLSEVQDKHIMGRIHRGASELADLMNVDGIGVKIDDYLELSRYLTIDKEFRGEETYSYGNATAYFDYMKKEYPEQAKVFKDLAEKYEQLSPEEYDKYLNSHPDVASCSLSDMQFYENVPNFVKDKKIQELKNYMRENFYQERDLDYSRQNKEAIKRLYTEKYLSQLPEAARERCERIYDSFGVKMFLADENDTKSLDFIYNELLEWQKAGKGKAKLPPIIDLSMIKQKYIDKVFKSAGYHEHDSHNISVQGYLNDIKYALRHEIAHANDSKIDVSDGIITVYKKDGTTEGINIDEIIVHKTVQKYDENGKPMFNPDGTPVLAKKYADDGTLDPDMDKCKFVDEFRNAGIPDWHISYAYTNKKEFLAVAAEGDYSKYSPEFKELLVKLGLPDWMFKMKNRESITPDANLYTNKFSKKYTDEENQKISAHSEDFYNLVVKNQAEVNHDYWKHFRDYYSVFGIPTTGGGTIQTRVKDLAGLNEKIYREIDRVDEKIADLSDIDKFNKEKLRKGDEPLTQEAADILIEKYNAQKQSLINDYDTVRNTIQDAFGARLVMDDTSPAAIAKVHKSLLNAIDSGEIKILEINNYQGEGGMPYFSSAQVKQLQAHCRRQGYELMIISDVNAPKGKEGTYKKDYNSKKAVKASGYTTCQLNIQHKNGVISEFQIRGKHINELAESEHIFYDISQNKDLSKGNPAIKQLTDPLVAVVKEMNAEGNEEIKKAYSEYLTECYKYARMQELNIPMAKPVLPPIVNPMLDIDNIIAIHAQMEALK